MFDSENIVLSFAAISDTHISDRERDMAEGKLSRALSTLERVSREHGRRIDFCIGAGDLVDNPRGDTYLQLEKFKSIYSSHMSAPLFYCFGDRHDLMWGGENEAEVIEKFYNTFKDDSFSFDVDKDCILKGNRHAVVNGYHFIALEPCQRIPVLYSAETKEWLSNILDSVDEDKYVFVMTHPMIKGTCYGSMHGIGWATEELTPILSKHSNAVVFCGHLHHPINDERSIMQTDFTAVGCGAVKYMAIEQGGFEEMSSPATMIDCNFVSSGHLCEVDVNGALRITRLDFSFDKEIKEPWIIPSPKKDRSHLKRYTADRGQISTSPWFGDGFCAEIRYGKETPVLVFSAAHDEDLVHHYDVDVYVNDEAVSTHHILADFYRHPTPSLMAKEICLKLKN